METEPDPSTSTSTPSAPSTPLTPAINPILDEDKYREEVLLSPSAEAEQARAQQLYHEALQLGLKVPGVRASGSLSASGSGVVADISSPILSSGSSTDRNSVFEDTDQTIGPVSPSQYDHVASSISQITIDSGAKPGSTRSMASASTRPTSYYSIDSHTAPGATPGGLGYEDALRQRRNRNSLLSVASADRQEKRRSSFRSALSRIHFRKKRTPDGGEHVRVDGQPRPRTSHADDSDRTRTPRPHPTVYDKEALQRSLDHPQLKEMQELHKMEMERHMEFEEAALRILRRRHETMITERESLNEREEDEKREKNLDDTVNIEERQLAVEMEQEREFERAKLNSRTRIKHMEGYFRNASPPPSPAGTRDRSSESFSSETTDSTAPTRRFTQQQREQLEQQYHDHKAMDHLHEARIKVLRDRQEKRLREAVARMERELDQLIKHNIQKLQDLQSELHDKEMSLIDALDAKKTELQHRWHLEEAVLRRKLEVESGLPYGPLPQLSFDKHPETRDSAICVQEGEAEDPPVERSS
ncbi:hypothetical protein N7470_005182 [Penicillium chermesinum]|nr:hypothetical protein N7470_005182 [Penicillium chermesinum]